MDLYYTDHKFYNDNDYIVKLFTDFVNINLEDFMPTFSEDDFIGCDIKQDNPQAILEAMSYSSYMPRTTISLSPTMRLCLTYYVENNYISSHYFDTTNAIEEIVAMPGDIVEIIVNPNATQALLSEVSEYIEETKSRKKEIVEPIVININMYML